VTIKLTLILSGRTLQRHEFQDDMPRVRVGRSPECEVTIDNLGVSRVHCEVLQKAGVFQLRDMKSGNGTFVNGGKITGVHNLNSGDMISLGKFTLRFEADANGSPAEDPSDESGPREGLMTLQMDPSSLAKKHRQQMSRSTGYVSLTGGRDVVIEKSLFTFGKGSECDVQLSGWFCPRVCAILIKDESGFRLVDVSPRGDEVTVNGIHKRDTWLNAEDRVEIRKTRMQFHRGLPVGRT